MTTQEVANQLVTLCRKGKYDQVYADLYAPGIVSIEPEDAAWETKITGMDGIRQKGQQWQDMVEEVISSDISDPIVADHFFSITMKTKVKIKGMEDPYDMDEVCVYHVLEGKVVAEQFFYTPMPK
jgi:uncharacterized surface protein with fasciclin (FAS1) repeats